MKKALSCQTPGRALPPPRAVPQRHGGRVPPPDRSEAANQAVDCVLAKHKERKRTPKTSAPKNSLWGVGLSNTLRVSRP